MSTKKGFGLGGMKSGWGRMKQKTLQKFGKSDATVDVQFNQEKSRYDAQYKSLKALRKAIDDYVKALKSVANAHASMTEHIHNLYDASCPLWNACLAQEKVRNDIDNLRNELEELWQADFHHPFAEHLAQYKMLTERIDERERRKVDMDRYRYDAKKLLEKQSPTAQAKAAQAKEKAESMTRAYQEMNQELLRDMPALVEDRFGFFDPLFATIVDGQTQYFNRSAESFAQLNQYFKGVDRKGSHSRARVITESEDSAYSRPIYLPGGVVGTNVKEKQYHQKPAHDGLGSVSQTSRGDGFMSTQASGYGGGSAAYNQQYGGGDTNSSTQMSYNNSNQPQQMSYNNNPPQQQMSYNNNPPQQQARALPQRGGMRGAPRGGMRGAPRGGMRGAPRGGMRGAPRGGMRGAPRGGMRGAPRGGMRGAPRGGMRGAPRGGMRGAPRGRGGAPMRRGSNATQNPNIVRAKALYPFQAEDASELSFQWNDIIIIHNQNGEWWEGEDSNGKRGLLPKNYVEIIQ